jgi:hypothetical protein
MMMELTWTTQYTYDKLGRVPDRGPTRETLPAELQLKWDLPKTAIMLMIFCKSFVRCEL